MPATDRLDAPPIGPNLDALLAPRSIAVVGASADRSKLSGLPLFFLRRHGYAGQVFPINPRGGEVNGLRVYRALAEVQQPIDLAMVLLPAEATAQAVADCVAAGVRSAIVSASGFAETGDAGRGAQDALVATARAGGLRVLGPNCMGLVNLRLGATACFSQSLMVERLRPGHLAFLSQSGAIGGSTMDQCHSRGIGLSHWLSTGNQADVDVVECARYLLGDPEVHVVALYLESVGSPAAYLALLREAQAAGKPLLVLKSGQSDTGRAAAASHTGALAGDDAVFRAVSRQFGAILVDDVEALVDAAAALLTGRRADGRGVGVVTSSGGVGVLLADEAARLGLDMATLNEATRTTLARIVPVYGSTANPVDVTASLVARMMGGEAGLWQGTYAAVAADPGVDQLVVGLTMVTGEPGVVIADELIAAVQQTPKPVTVAWLGADLCRPGLQRLAEASVPTYPSTARAMRVAALLAQHPPTLPADALVTAPAAVQAAVQALPEGCVDLTEWQCQSLLKAAGLRTPAGSLAGDAATAAAVAPGLGERVVLKVQSPAIPHKTEAGAVRVGVPATEVASVAAEMLANARRIAPTDAIEGVLVQELVTGGLEAIVGVTRDPQFGLVLAVGVGGILVETLGEVTLRHLPLTPAEIAAVCRAGTLPRLLRARRSPAEADALLDVLTDAVTRVVQLAEAHAPRLRHLEVNPLLIRTDGCVALDCSLGLDATP